MDFMKQYSDYSLQKLKAEGASSAEILIKTKEMNSMVQFYKNPFLRFLMTIAEILPVGILISLIAAAILKKTDFSKTLQTVNI